MDFMSDLATTLGITPDREKQADLSPGARRAMLATGGALLAAGGAAGGAAAAGRKRVSEERIPVAGGIIHAIGERRYVKDMIRAANNRDFPAIMSTAQKLVSATFQPQQKYAGASCTQKSSSPSEAYLIKLKSVAKRRKQQSPAQEKTAVSIKSLSPTAKALTLGTGSAIAGAAGVYGAMKGRDFAIMDTPLGTLGGRKRDLRGLINAARKGDREKFDDRLSRVAPMHPVVTQAVRSKRSTVERVARLITSQEQEKQAASLAGIKALLQNLWSRAGARAAGRFGRKRLAGTLYKGAPAAKGVGAKLVGGAEEVAFPAMGRKALTPVAPALPAMAGTAPAQTRHALPQMASQEAAKKPWLTRGQKTWLGIGGLGAGTFWLGGKALGEAGATMRAGMASPQGGYMSQYRFS